jgi:hypothetical protein
MKNEQMTNFQATFERLKKILSKYEKRLTVTVDKPGMYYLDGGYSEKYKRVAFFSAVMIKKNYVSYHLMSLYAFPEINKGISPALKKRMQGKACFNFTAVDDELFAELAELTKRSYERYKEEGWTLVRARTGEKR